MQNAVDDSWILLFSAYGELSNNAPEDPTCRASLWLELIIRTVEVCEWGCSLVGSFSSEELVDDVGEQGCFARTRKSQEQYDG